MSLVALWFWKQKPIKNKTPKQSWSLQLRKNTFLQIPTLLLFGIQSQQKHKEDQPYVYCCN